LPSSATRELVLKAIKDHVVADGRLCGQYARQSKTTEKKE
jgi:hypothetical protein